MRPAAATWLRPAASTTCRLDTTVGAHDTDARVGTVRARVAAAAPHGGEAFGAHGTRRRHTQRGHPERPTDAVNLRLDASLAKEIERTAEWRRRSVSEVARDLLQYGVAIERDLEAQEWKHPYQDRLPGRDADHAAAPVRDQQALVRAR
jgi:Ribbon-helix-helix protein, copG family